MKIPKTFKIGALHFDVTKVDRVDKEHALGITDFDAGTIKLLNGIRRERLEQAHCHELIHILFFAAGREDLGHKEGLVDTMAIFLHQYFETQKGEL